MIESTSPTDAAA